MIKRSCSFCQMPFFLNNKILLTLIKYDLVTAVYLSEFAKQMEKGKMNILYICIEFIFCIYEASYPFISYVQLFVFLMAHYNIITFRKRKQLKTNKIKRKPWNFNKFQFLKIKTCIPTFVDKIVKFKLFFWVFFYRCWKSSKGLHDYTSNG